MIYDIEQPLGTCDGYPQQECANEATNSVLGWKLCDECARKYVEPTSGAAEFTKAHEQALADEIAHDQEMTDRITELEARIAEMKAHDEEITRHLESEYRTRPNGVGIALLVRLSAIRAENARLVSEIKARDVWLNAASATIEQYAAKYGPLS